MSANKLADTFRMLVAMSKDAILNEPPSIAKAKLPAIAAAIFVDRVQSKPTTDLNLLLNWQFSVREKTTDHLTNKEIRRLAWEPDVSLSEVYLAELSKRNLVMSRGLAKGLVYSALATWGEPRSIKARTMLAEKMQLGASSPYLTKVAPFAIAENGHVATANSLISNKSSVSTTIAQIFGIAAVSTSYGSSVLSSVIETGYQKVLSSDTSERNWFYSEILQHVNKDTLLSCLDKVVAAIDQNKNEAAKEEFKRFVLFHPNLGDPRLPGYESNWPKEKAITQKVIEWLSQSDIRFFFELFIEKDSDHQGRKQFWLKYAHLVKGTRVIISSYDRSRLARQINEMKRKSGSSNLFADLLDSSEKATAFMMDFGSVIVVEFSQSGHACYYYEATSKFKFSERRLFWSTAKFAINDLKNKTLCRSPLTHHRDIWEAKFVNILASCGLRPKSDR